MPEKFFPAMPLVFAALVYLCLPATAAEKELRAGSLSGILLLPEAPSAPVALIIPGSGPTDRDGNNPHFGNGQIYRLLAEGLAKAGIGTLRIDKRGMFGSAAKEADANSVVLQDYADDAHLWIRALRKETGNSCVWVAGHSEGGLVALLAAQKPEGICGLILLATPGRTMGEILRAQLIKNPANAPLLPAALSVLSSLEKGEHVDTAALPPPVFSLFRPEVQPFLIDLMRYDPAALIAGISLPVLIIQGESDMQINPEDARRLHEARPSAKLLSIPGMTHALKKTKSSSAASNLATYSNPDIPIADEVADGIAEFVKKR